MTAGTDTFCDINLAISSPDEFLLSYHQLRASAARHAAAAELRACGRGNAVGLTSILDRGQFL